MKRLPGLQSGDLGRLLLDQLLHLLPLPLGRLLLLFCFPLPLLGRISRLLGCLPRGFLLR